MKKNDLKANGAKNSTAVAGIENLAAVAVVDNTQTKGKIAANYTAVNQAEAEEQTEKIDKNKLFAEISEYLCPFRFDSAPIIEALQPLKETGVLSEEAVAAAVEKSKRQFFEDNAAEIEAAEKLSFSEFVEKLQENTTLYKNLQQVCNIDEIDENNYFANGLVVIYRGAQCKDKEGNNRYHEQTLEAVENGVKFSVPLFSEYRDEMTVTNYLLSVRYYINKQNAQKTLLNKIRDYKLILSNVAGAAKRAKENNFSLEQVLEAVEKVFSE